MKTAAAYIRVSTDEQTEFSPDSQLGAIRRYAAEHGFLLPDGLIFMDEGISGRNADKRPAFQEMIRTAKLKPRQFDVILLWKFSRFARNRQDSIVYKSMLRKQCGIDVISVSEQLGDDNTSVLIEALIEAMDEYYSLNLAEEVRRGMNERFSRGGVISQPPFGYKMSGGIFVPDEEKAGIVRMIFDEFINGTAVRTIASKLNSMGIRTSRGNLFENRTVEYILTNPVYTGKLRRCKGGQGRNDRFHEDTENIIFVDGKHQPLISADIFRSAQLRRAEIKKLYGRYDRQAPADLMLKGLVRCSDCGATLVHQARTGSLQCHNYARGTCRVSHCVSLKKLNALIISRLRSDLADGKINIRPKETNSAANDRDTVSILIEKEKRRLDRFREAYSSGIDSLDEYRENKSKTLRRIDELRASASQQRFKPETNKRRAAAPLDFLEDENVSEAVKNIALRSVIDKIIFVKPDNIIRIFYK